MPWSRRATPASRSSTAAAPARSAGAGRQPSELIGLGAALVLLLIMFGSIVAALIPLVGAIFSVGAGLSISGWWPRPPSCRPPRPRWRRCSASASPSTTGCSWWPGTASSSTMAWTSTSRSARPRPRSGAAIVDRRHAPSSSPSSASTSSGVPFVGALGLASAIVVAVTMMSALTLVPALLGIARDAPSGPESERREEAAGGRTPTTPTRQRVRPLGPAGQRRAVAVGDRQRWSLLAVLADPAVLDPARPARRRHRPDVETEPAGLRPDRDGFGRGRNGPLTVVRRRCRRQSQHDTQSLLESTAEDTRGHRRRRRGRRPAAQPGRRHRDHQRHPDHRPAGRGDHRPGRQPPRRRAARTRGERDLRRRHDGRLRRLHREGGQRMPWLIARRRAARPAAADGGVPVAGRSGSRPRC